MIYNWDSKPWFLEAFEGKTIEQIKEYLNKHLTEDFEPEDLDELAEEIKEYINERPYYKTDIN